MRALVRSTYYRFFPTRRPNVGDGKKFDDTFVVGNDGSISLNYESETVKKAFAKNIKKLQNMKEAK